MKKIIFSLFFLVFYIFPVLADYNVDSVNVSAQVAASGRTEVTSTFQLTFLTSQEDVTIPLPEGDISSITVSNYRYSTRETEHGTNLVLHNSKGFTGTQAFVVSYRLPSFQADGSSEDLYSLNLLSSRWAKSIGSCSIQVTLPGSDVTLPEDYTMSPQLLSGYYGDLDPLDAPLEIAGTMISGTVPGLMAYDTLTLQVSLPDGYFRVRSGTIPMVSLTWWCAVMAGVLGLCIIYWRLRLRSGHQQISARLLAPEGILPYQLPAVLDGETIDFAALILQWANLGYLSLSYSRNQQLILKKNMDMGSERSTAEQWLFQRVFGRRRKTIASPGRFSGAAAQFRTAAKQPVAQIAFDRSGGNIALVQLPCRLLTGVGIGYTAYCMFPEGGGFVVLAVLLGGLGLLYSIYLHQVLSQLKALGQFSLKTILCLVLALVLLVLGLLSGALLEMAVGLLACGFSAFATAAGPKRSPQGQELVAQARGCRRFYRQAPWHRLQIYLSANHRFFQTELPQAVALHSEKAFARRFERLSVPYPEWLPTKNTGSLSPEKLVDCLAPVIQALRQAFR